jgi:hypothetical protein
MRPHSRSSMPAKPLTASRLPLTPRPRTEPDRGNIFEGSIE